MNPLCHIRVRVGCATSAPDALFCIESRNHKDAELCIQSLDNEISKRCIAEETLYAVIDAVKKDFLESGEEIDETAQVIEFEDRVGSYLDDFIPCDIISLSEARSYWEIIHRSRMALYPHKEVEKEKRKKAYHAMKRLSYQVLDKSCNSDFVKAYNYYLGVSK